MTVCTTIIAALVRTKIRLQTQLASYKTTVKYNAAASEPESTISSTNVDTRKNIAYEPNPEAVDTEKNIAYEPNRCNLAAVNTKKNIAYEPNPAVVKNNN